IEQHADGHSIDVIKMANVLSNTAGFTTTNLQVNPYTDIANVPPKQPDGTDVVDNIDSRILKAAEASHTIVATHAVAVSGTEDDARWYEVDVSGATPVLKDQGNISAGNNHYLYYPAIDINAAGDIGMTYMQSGTDPNDFMGVYVTGRRSGDAAG